jgi:hypothetical protein
MLSRAASYMYAVVVTIVLAYPSSGLPTESRPHEIWDDYKDFEVKACRMREDFGSEPLYDCVLQYYYHIPCPTYSWFWAYYGWEPGDILSTSFRLSDQGTGGYDVCDPIICTGLDQIRILDFAGYGTIYPGLFTIEMSVYCSDASPYPGYSLWRSGPLETHFGWNYFDVNDPDGRPLSVAGCFDGVATSFAVTMHMVGSEGVYPMVGFDNIGTALEVACELHDRGCMPAVYPRDWAGGEEPRVHSGYVGQSRFQYWPPLGMPDGTCVSPGSVCERGFVEAAWRIYMACWSP